MSMSDVIILFTTVLICTVSNQKVQLMEGTPVLLTKEFNVKPSPIAPVYTAPVSTENAAVPSPGAEIQPTKTISTPILETTVSPGNVEPINVIKTASVYAAEHPTASYTIEPTPKLAPNVAAPPMQTTWDHEAIAPTQVVKPSASGSFTAPSTNLRPPKF